jgi:WD40 repeat protein
VWEIATGKEVTHMPHDISITALAFSPDEKYMASGGGDGSVYVWVPNGEQQISKIIDGYLYPSLSPNGQFLVADNGCIQYHNNICLYQYALRKVLALTQAQYVPIFTQFSPNDQYIVSKSCKSGQLCTQSTLYIWDVSSGKEVNHKDYHSDVTFDISPDGKYMISAVKETFDMTPVGELTVSAEGETTAHLWETSTGKEIVQMSHKDPIDFVAFSPNGKYVVGVGCDVKNNKSFCTQSSSIVWSVETGKEVAHFTHKGSVAPMFIGLAGDYSVSTTFSADGQHIVSEECDHRYEDGFCAQHTIIIWNATTGQAVSDWFDISSKVFFNPQKDYLAAIGADKALHILEISSGKEVTRISIASDVKDVAFSPDGKYIATEDSDNAGHVWDITTGKEVARITHNREVYGVAFSLDGKHIISQYGNATIIWEWHADDLIANACQHMPRNLTRAEWAQFIGDAMPYQAVCENLPIEPEVTDTPTVTP